MPIIEKKSANILLSFDKIKGIFTGYASVFNEIDRVNDTISPEAYNDEVNAWKEGKSIPINFEHETSIILSPNLDKMIIDEKGLLVEWTFSEEAKSLYPDIWLYAVSKAQASNLFMSIGFVVLKSKLGTQRYFAKKKNLQPDTIYKVNLNHIAMTSEPADINAKILEVKSFKTPKYPIDLSENWDNVAAEKRWREYTNSIEKPSTQYKNGFLYIEDGKEELFGSYHFLVVDIIDGEPMINQQAVITANSYLHGARRGVKILDEQGKRQILEIISTLYTKINRLRLQNGIDLLPAVEIKSIEPNLNHNIKAITGSVSAKRFLKEYKSTMSNRNIEHFIDHITNLSKNIEADKPLPQEAPALEQKSELDSLFEQVALKLNNKK